MSLAVALLALALPGAAADAQACPSGVCPAAPPPMKADESVGKFIQSEDSDHAESLLQVQSKVKFIDAARAYIKDPPGRQELTCVEDCEGPPEGENATCELAMATVDGCASDCPQPVKDAIIASICEDGAAASMLQHAAVTLEVEASSQVEAHKSASITAKDTSASRGLSDAKTNGAILGRTAMSAQSREEERYMIVEHMCETSSAECEEEVMKTNDRCRSECHQDCSGIEPGKPCDCMAKCMEGTVLLIDGVRKHFGKRKHSERLLRIKHKHGLHGSLSNLFAQASPCRLSGVWHSPMNHSVAFDAEDLQLKLRLGDTPELLMTWVADDKGSVERERLLVGGEELRRDNLQEVVRDGSVEHLQSFSTMLASVGLSGSAAPSGCYYRLHHALLGLRKLSDTLSSTRALHERGTSSRDGSSRRRTADDCPNKPPYAESGDGGRRRTRTSASNDYDSRRRWGMSGGWFADDTGVQFKCADWITPGLTGLDHGSGYATVGCENPGGNHGGSTNVGICQGMCGYKCNCWLGMFGADYKCNYNKACCIHDYTCDNHDVGNFFQCLMGDHWDALTTASTYNLGSPYTGPLKAGQGCSGGGDGWCQSGSCNWVWGFISGWYC